VLSPWVGMGVVMGLMVAMMAGLRLYRRAHPTQTETVRKLLHIGMGLVTLSFPWLFDSAWPVVALGVVTIPMLVALRRSRHLKRYLGGVIDAVERESWGELCFPLGVAILFVLSHGDPLLYCIPILVLTLADAVAALVGTTYGQRHFSTVAGERKSAEGSTAFFTVAFLSVHVPLLLFGGAGRAETLLIGLILAVLVTLAEAIAWRGLDNVIVPLATYVLLKVFLGLSVAELAGHLLVVSALAALGVALRKRSTLDESAMLAAILGGYVIGTLGGWQWLLIPMVVVLRDKAMPSVVVQGTTHFHNLHTVASVITPSLGWLFLARSLGRLDFLFPFALGFAVHQAVFEIAKTRRLGRVRSLASAVTVGGAVAWLLVFAPFVMVQGPSGSTLLHTLWGLPVVLLAAAGFCAMQPGMEDVPRDVMRWVRQAAWATAGSIAGVVPILLLGMFTR